MRFICANTTAVIERLIEGGELEKFDILYTDAALPLSNEAFANFKALYDSLVTRRADGTLESVAFQVLSLNQWMAPTTSSYVVNRDAVGTMHRMFEAEMAAGPQLPIESFLRTQIETGALQGGFIFSFLTSVRPERTIASTMRRTPDAALKFTVADIARMSFFINCNWSECEALFDRFLPPTPPDRHAHILAHARAHSLTIMKKDDKNVPEKSAAPLASNV